MKWENDTFALILRMRQMVYSSKNFVVLRDIVNILSTSHIEISLDKMTSDNSKAIYGHIINE